MHRQGRLSAVLLASGLFGFVQAGQTATIDPSTSWGPWDGWGVSLAWWAAAFGNRSELATAFFSLEASTINGYTIPGLGLNIARYNAGASSYNGIDGQSMVESPKIIPSRLVDGYWIDWDSNDTASSSWSWSVDANQRNMLQLARDNGADTFELFSNSPMWWMCYNHNPSGSNDGSSDNLQTWNHAQHALYLASIAAYAKENWNISFSTVEAFNEPASDWWNGETGTQEGCHFDVATQATIIPLLRSELDAQGLQAVQVAASDENTYDIAISTWQGLGANATAVVQQINVHGYQYGGGRRDVLYDLASEDGKKLWNSEFGDGDGTGTGLVQNLMLDMYWLHPNAWVYWQAIDGGGWGLIDGDNDNLTLGAPEKKYFTLAQFSRHIRPGMSILSSSLENVVAAYSASEHKLVLVAANWDSAGYMNFDLSKFSSASSTGSLVPRWSTQVNGTNDYAEFKDTYMSGTQFWSYFQQGEVQTFEISNVSI